MDFGSLTKSPASSSGRCSSHALVVVERCLHTGRRSCSRGRRASVPWRQEDRLNHRYDRRTPSACPAHAGSHAPTDSTPATTRLPARSSCEWAGSLYCVTLPFGVPVQRTVTSRGSTGAIQAVQTVRSAILNPPKRPIPASAPSPQHLTDRSTAPL